MSKLLTTSEMTRYISGEEDPIKENTVEGWRVKGTGPSYVKIGHLVRYRVEDLDKWLASQVRSSTSQVSA